MATRPAILFALGLISFLSTLPGFSATVSGKVTDGSRLSIPGARITLFNADTAFFRESRSNAAGTYSLDSIPDGIYKVGASAIGSEYQEPSKSVAGVGLILDFTLGAETNSGE